MIKAVIFDLDGTLLDTLDDLTNSVNEALRLENFSLRSKEEVRSFIGNGAQSLLKRALPEAYKNDEIIKQKMLAHFTKHYKVHNNDLTKPYYGILDMLDTLSLSSYRLAILSNKPHEALVYLCEQHFQGRFEKVYGAREGVAKKPSKEPLLNLISEMELQPEQVLYIGDSEVDIETAKSAKVKVLAVTWGFRNKDFLMKKNPDSIVDHPDEIVAYVLSR